MQMQRITRARAALFPDHPNFEQFVRDVRNSVPGELALGQQVSVVVHFEESEDQLRLLETHDRRRDILLGAIRAEALYFPPGYRWHPYELPTEFELAPILAWNGSNLQWIQ